MMNIISSQLITPSNWGRTQPNHRNMTFPINRVNPTTTPDMLFYEGMGDGQDVHVLLMEGSTEEDPVVRIKGHSYNGEFDFTCHVFLCGNVRPVWLAKKARSQRLR